MSDYTEKHKDLLDVENILKTREEQQPRLYAKGLKDLHDTYESVPEYHFEHTDFSGSDVILGQESDLTPEKREELIASLKGLHPWRKGPFNIAGIELDAEWRSDKKWDRVKKVTEDLKGKKVLDIGCNNGYFMYRMLEENPEIVLGVDPTIRYFFQFQALQKLAPANQLYMEPYGLEYVKYYPSFFDVVFCMGILYHHQNPVGILKEINSCMAPGAQLIIETQGIPGDEPYALFPEKRYAKVPGTYFVPTAPCVVNWMKRALFENIEVFYTHDMNSKEQRKTEWMEWESYEDFVDIESGKTVEGYPAPIRIYVSATKRLR